MQFFWFNQLINLVEEGKWLLAVTFFKATNSVFNITDENNSFSVSTPSLWNFEDSGDFFFNELNNLLELRSRNGIELHVEQVGKKGLLLINNYSLSSLLKMNFLKNQKIQNIMISKI